MLKCPSCYEELKQQETQCPHCHQFIIDDILDLDFPSVDRISCIYCGKKVVKRAKFCKYCRKWLDEVNQNASEIDPEDLI